MDTKLIYPVADVIRKAQFAGKDAYGIAEDVLSFMAERSIDKSMQAQIDREIAATLGGSQDVG